MNWEKAYHTFANTFLKSYPQTSVPDDVIFPWNAYEVNRADFGEESSVVWHLHYYSESEETINAMADKIVKALRGGHTIDCENGKMVLFSGSPSWMSVEDETDNNHKHRMINVKILWLIP